MASSARAPVVHQDYIARIRYSNALPPPPNPPRLLDIPNTGLAGGQYTAPGFASRLAREQPLNIEADAELGMPLDLVGMPGIFDGDEISIQAPPHPPSLHPRDRALLRPLAALGKPKLSDAGVSFLRRTEYTTSHATSKTSRYDSASKSLVGRINSRAKRTQNVDRESPEFIKSQIAKGFEIAAANLKNSSRVVHPSNRDLKLVGAYPLIPDVEAFGDIAGFIELKFGKHPSLRDVYDTRLETGILVPQAPSEEQAEKHEQSPQEMAMHDYRLFILPDPVQSENYKRKFDPTDLMTNDDTLYPEITNINKFGNVVIEDAEPVMGGAFRFGRVRDYKTTSSHSNGIHTPCDEEVSISIEEGDRCGRQKAAYYSPVLARIHVEPQREKNIAKKFGKLPDSTHTRQSLHDNEPVDEGGIASLLIRLIDPSESDTFKRKQFSALARGKQPQMGEGDEEDVDGHHESDDEASAQLYG